MSRKAVVALVAVVLVIVLAIAIYQVCDREQSDYMQLTDKVFIADDGSQYPVYTGNVGIISSLCDVPYYYSDGYFIQDPKIYNSSLATMSFMLASNGFSYSAGYDEQSAKVRDFLAQMGCLDIHANKAFDEKPTEDSIGVAMGTMKRTVNGNDIIIIPVVIRSGNYGAEWASNFTVGQGVGESEGFSSAAGQVVEELRKYMSDHGIDGHDGNVRFWMTGYSRGAAVINIAAKDVLDIYDSSGDRTYVYTFATPSCAVRSGIVEGNDYTGIHNIYDRRDIVPTVPPTDFGMFRYGVDHFVPGKEAGETVFVESEIDGALDTDTVRQMIDNYDGMEVDISRYEGYERMCLFLDDIFGLSDDNEFSTALLTLDGKIVDVRDEEQSVFVRELAESIVRFGDLDRQAYADGDASLQGCITQIIRSECSLAPLVTSFMTMAVKAAPVMEKNRDNPQAVVDFILNECGMPSVLKQAGITDEQYEYLVGYMVKTIHRDMESNGWAGSKILGTLINSGITLIKYHIPAYMPCWLMALDPMYDDLALADT